MFLTTLDDFVTSLCSILLQAWNGLRDNSQGIFAYFMLFVPILLFLVTIIHKFVFMDNK